MKIEIEVSARSAKRILIISASLIALGVSGIASAAVPQFTAGEELTEGKLNGNFNALDTRVTALESRPIVFSTNGKTYSLGATFKAVTVAVQGKLTTASKEGREASKELCEAVTSPSGHMCKGEELARSREMGLQVPKGWYTTGAIDSSAGSPDCLGWTYAEASYSGPYWQGNNGDTTPCNTSAVVLCCD